MLKETMTYVNFDGEEVTEDLYFNLSTVELHRANAKYGGNIEEEIKRIIANDEAEKMVEILEYIILTSYGVKSPDGKRFIKTKEDRENFEYSIAYAELFTSILMSPQKAKSFAEGLFSSSDSRRKQFQGQLDTPIA